VAGTRQVVTITFDTILAPLAFSTPVTFGDVPIVREVISTNADPLFATYAGGAVTFATGLESDVTPRFDGDDILTVTDYTQTGLFAVGLDTPNPSFNEFQRADSAPIETRGDGLLTVADYVQAGRYAVSLDLPLPAGGPAFQSAFSIEGMISKYDKPEQFSNARVISAVGTTATPGRKVNVSIQIEASGDENGVGLTIGYDAAKLGNPVVTTGKDMPFASPLVNILTPGKIGIITTMPTLSTMPAGTLQMLTIQFDVSSTAPGGETTISLDDAAPVVNQISDAAARALPAKFVSGIIDISGTSSNGVSVSGTVVSSSGMPISNVTIVLTDRSGIARSTNSNPFGFFQMQNIPTGMVYTLSATSKRYSFPTSTVVMNADLVGIDLVADP